MQKYISYRKSTHLGKLIFRFAFAAACFATSGQLMAADGYNLLSSQGGRYVYGWAGGSAKTAAMLDTQTGRMWELLCMVNDVDEAAKITEQRCEYTALTPIYFKNEDGSLSLTPDGKRFRLKSGAFDDIPSTQSKK